MTRGVRPGWYPDYEAGEGYVRYWDGEGWTDRRDTAAALLASDGLAVTTAPRRSLRPWGIGLALALVALVIGVLALGGGDEPASDGSTPPPASTPGPPPSEVESSVDADGGGADAGDAAEGRRTYEVETVLDGGDLQLTNGAVVRLIGIALPTTATCATEAVFTLSDLTDGRTVTLTKRGPDRAADGVLLRYVERDGLDVGARLIQRGLATATDEAHARGPVYRRVDARSEPAC